VHHPLAYHHPSHRHRIQHSNHRLSLRQIRHRVHRDSWQWQTSMSRSCEHLFAVSQG
jgi:hypothetical protein